MINVIKKKNPYFSYSYDYNFRKIGIYIVISDVFDTPCLTFCQIVLSFNGWM